MGSQEKMPLVERLFLVCFFIVPVFLTIQFKINNVAAVRPLYQFGLICAGLIILILIAAWREDGQAALKQTKNIIFSRFGALAAAFFLYVGASALLAGQQAFKDFLYFSAWTMISVGALLLLASAAVNMQRFQTWVTVGIVAQAALASVVAIAVRFGLELDFGEYRLLQAYWVSKRLHGYLGDPTAFGGLVGLALICVASWRPAGLTVPRVFLLGGLVACLIWSDSRNALLSLVIALGVFFGLTLRFKELAMAESTLVVSYVIGRLTDEGHTFFTRADEKGSEDSRLYIWNEVIKRLEASNLVEILFGHGAQQLKHDYRSAFNTTFETLYDYGIVGLVLLGCVVLYAAGMLLSAYKSDRFVSAFGLSLIAYFCVFSQFWTTVPRWFFVYPLFGMILAVVLGVLATARRHVFKHGGERGPPNSAKPRAAFQE